MTAYASHCVGATCHLRKNSYLYCEETRRSLLPFLWIGLILDSILQFYAFTVNDKLSFIFLNHSPSEWFSIYFIYEKGRPSKATPKSPPCRSGPPGNFKSAGGTLSQANFKEGAGATAHFTSYEPHPTPQPAAQPSIEPPRQTSIMAPRSAPVQADRAASVGPNLSDRRLWPSGSRAQPWSLFAFFLSIQKEGPRRRGGRRADLKIAGKGGKGPRPKKGKAFGRPPPTTPAM